MTVNGENAYKGTNNTNMGIISHVDFTVVATNTGYVLDSDRSYLIDIRGRDIINFAYISNADVIFRTQVAFNDYNDLDTLGFNDFTTVTGDTTLSASLTHEILEMDISTYDNVATAFLLQFKTSGVSTATVNGILRNYNKEVTTQVTFAGEENIGDTDLTPATI